MLNLVKEAIKVIGIDKNGTPQRIECMDERDAYIVEQTMLKISKESAPVVFTVDEDGTNSLYLNEGVDWEEWSKKNINYLKYGEIPNGQMSEIDSPHGMLEVSRIDTGKNCSVTVKGEVDAVKYIFTLLANAVVLNIELAQRLKETSNG